MKFRLNFLYLAGYQQIDLINLYFFLICVQLRKAIEDVNSGNLTSNQSNNTPTTEKPPLEPQEVPLLSNDDEKNEKCENADKDNQYTVDSMDSALSNSDNCSDVELGHPVQHKIESK